MQRQVKCLVDPPDDEVAVRLQDPFAMTAHLAWRHRAGRVLTLRLLHHRRTRNTEPGPDRPAALTATKSPPQSAPKDRWKEVLPSDAGLHSSQHLE